MLFIAILAMSSCSKEDNTSSPTQSLAQMLVGEWIMELPVSGLEADPVSGIVIPDDADMLTMIFHFDADGYGWKELNVMREGEMIYSAMNRYENGFTYTIDEEGKIKVDYDEKDSNDKLHFNGYTLIMTKMVSSSTCNVLPMSRFRATRKHPMNGMAAATKAAQ